MESRLKAGGEGSSPEEWKVLAAAGLAEGKKVTKFFVYCDGVREVTRSWTPTSVSPRRCILEAALWGLWLCSGRA